MPIRFKPVALALACLFAPAALGQPVGLPKLEVDPALTGAPAPEPKPAPPPAAKQPEAATPPAPEAAAAEAAPPAASAPEAPRQTAPAQAAPSPDTAKPTAPAQAPAPATAGGPAGGATELPKLEADPALVRTPAPVAAPKPEAPAQQAAPVQPAPASPAPAAVAPPPVQQPQVAGPIGLPALEVDPALIGPRPATRIAAPVPRPAPAASAVSGAPAPAAPPTPVAAVPAEPPVRLQASRGLQPVSTDQPLPTFVDAERIQGHQDDYVEAEGAARLRRYGQNVEADRIRYRQETQDLTAEGNVRLEQGGNTVAGTRGEYNLETRRGFVERPDYALAQPAGRGSAAQFSLDGENRYSARDVSYTTCPAGNNDWFLRAADLDIDRVRQVGVAHHARVEFLGMPILYTPYIDFPLSEQRKSGLLPPVLGTTDTTGTDITVPYYWNIAPNMDATLAPRFMSRRGVMLDGEFRYLGKSYSGTLRGDWLGNDSETDTERWGISVKHAQNLGYGFSGAVDYQRVSDDNFLRDFGNRIALTSITTLPQDGYLSYGGGWWTATARYQTWQTLQDPAAPATPPYNREPQLLVSASRQDLRGFDAAFAGEYVNFKNSLQTLQSGDRLVAHPTLSYPLLTAGAFLVPRASLHYTHYSFSNPENRPATDRSIPILSLDSGLVFERDWSLGGTNFLQTLEPRAFYVYAPFKQQATLPVYDTAEADFNFAQLFSDNRFVGNDRVGDANQLTLALTSRLLEPATAAERMRFAVGQRFFFTRPRVFLLRDAPTGEVAEPTKSDFLAALNAKIGGAWLMDAGWQYDPSDSSTRKSSLGVRYQPAPSKVLNLGYRYTVNQLEQVGGSAQWPLGGGWWGLGVLDYSLRDGRTLNAVAGVEYNSACWALRVVAQRFVTTTQQTNNQFFIQLELRGLGKLGVNPMDLLRQSIPGYTPVTGPADPAPQ